MPSEVDICNASLAALGDSANVSRISPSDGSAQADHCARFYPASRDAVLEMHDWGFASQRATLAAVDFSFAQWKYAYAVPNQCIRVLEILDPTATDDIAQPVVYDIDPFGYKPLMQGIYTAQPFAIETDADGNRIIVTNQENAVARFTVQVTDTTRFSAMFCEALQAYLASKLAGPVIKGAEGRQAAVQWLQIAQQLVKKAALADANQRHSNVQQQVPWMVAR